MAFLILLHEHEPYVNNPSWNVLLPSMSNTQLYMTVSTSITQCIPTMNNSYLSAEVGIDELTTFPLPSIFDSTIFAIKSTNGTIGSDIKSYLGPNNFNLNNIATLIGDMSLVSSSVQLILNTLEMTNAKVGDLSNIVSAALPTLESMLDVSLSNNQ